MVASGASKRALASSIAGGDRGGHRSRSARRPNCRPPDPARSAFSRGAGGGSQRSARRSRVGALGPRRPGPRGGRWVSGFTVITRGTCRALEDARREEGAARPARGLGSGPTAGAEGRWSLVPPQAPVAELDDLAEAIAEQLLIRWGIVFRDLATRENLALPWREIVWALRRLEARGVIRGGRFVSGFTGEQFAMPEALEALARVRKKPREGARIRVCGADPLNLVGIITPGARVPSLRTREVIYLDGLPVELIESESAKIARSSPRDSPGIPAGAGEKLGTRVLTVAPLRRSTRLPGVGGGVESGVDDVGGAGGKDGAGVAMQDGASQLEL